MRVLNGALLRRRKGGKKGSYNGRRARRRRRERFAGLAYDTQMALLPHAALCRRAVDVGGGSKPETKHADETCRRDDLPPPRSASSIPHAVCS